jgi:exodeoxyribonuclease VII small subunit
MNNTQQNPGLQGEISFEAAFIRLEEILEKLNSSAVTLDESLQLYEEADKLILICNKRLTDAERKIETLVRNRNGELVLGSDQKPATQDFSASPPANTGTK